MTHEDTGGKIHYADDKTEKQRQLHEDTMEEMASAIRTGVPAKDSEPTCTEEKEFNKMRHFEYLAFLQAERKKLMAVRALLQDVTRCALKFSKDHDPDPVTRLLMIGNHEAVLRLSEDMRLLWANNTAVLQELEKDKLLFTRTHAELKAVFSSKNE